MTNFRVLLFLYGGITGLSEVTAPFFRSGKNHKIAIVSGIIITLCLSAIFQIWEIKPVYKAFVAAFLLFLIGISLGYYMKLYDLMMTLNQRAKEGKKQALQAKLFGIFWYSGFFILLISAFIAYIFLIAD